MKRRLEMLRLFCSLVFREMYGVRLWPWVAWDICKGAHPKWAWMGDGHYHEEARR